MVALCFWLTAILSMSPPISTAVSDAGDSEMSSFEERMRDTFPGIKNVDDFRNQTMSKVEEILVLLKMYPEDYWKRIVPGVDIKKLNESLHYFHENLPDIIGFMDGTE